MEKLFLIGLVLFLIPALYVNAANIIDGDLIKTEDSPDVYIIKILSTNSGVKQFKRLILNPEIFNQYGHLKWENVKTVSQAEMDVFIVSDLVRATGDEKVYKLYPNGDVGEKRWIKTAEDFNNFNYDFDSIYETNSFERDFYAIGSDLVYNSWEEPETPETPTRDPITINVPADYSTIQLAIDASINRDTIKVNSGIYNENIVLNKNIKLIADYLSVVLDGQGNGPAITIDGATDFLIQRFTIKSKDNRAIYCKGMSASSGTIKNTTIKDSGWGIYSEENCNLKAFNNLIYNIKDSGKNAGIGIYIGGNYSYGIIPEIINNTIDGNYHGIWLENSNVKIMNNIITNNLGLSNSTGIYHLGEGTSENTYNNIYENGYNYQGTAKAGNGSLVVYPRFLNSTQRNYKLTTGTSNYSLCLDAGNPELIYNDGTHSTKTARNDMGAYGGPDNIGWE